MSIASSSFQNANDQPAVLVDRDSFLEYGTSQSKEVKLEEWKRFPLALADQRQVWLQEKIRISNLKKQPPSSSEQLPNPPEPDHQWPRSSHFPKSQSTSPEQAQKWHFMHHGTHDAQGMIFEDYPMGMNEEARLDTHDNAAGNHVQPSGRLLEDDIWTSTPISQQDHGSMLDPIETLDGAYNENSFTEKSSPLRGRPLSGALFKPVSVARSDDVDTLPPIRKQRSSTSHKSGQQELDVERISADERHKYF